MTAPDARQVIADVIGRYDIPTGAWTEAEKAEPIDGVLAALAAAVGSDGDFAVVDGKVREWDADGLLHALALLVALKDGPRGEAYRQAKDLAWADARALLARLVPPVEPSGPDSSVTDCSVPTAPVDTPLAALAEIVTYKPWVYTTDDGWWSFATRCSFALSEIHAIAQAALNSGDSGDEDVTRVQAGQESAYLDYASDFDPSPGASRYDTGPPPHAVLTILAAHNVGAPVVPCPTCHSIPCHCSTTALPIPPAAGVSHTPGDET